MAAYPLWHKKHPEGQKLLPSKLKTLLTQKKPSLRSIIELRPIWAYLEMYGVVSQEDKDLIEAKPTRFEKVEALLDHVGNGPLWAFHGFLRSLAKANKGVVIVELGFRLQDYEDPEDDALGCTTEKHQTVADSIADLGGRIKSGLKKNMVELEDADIDDLMTSIYSWSILTETQHDELKSKTVRREKLHFLVDRVRKRDHKHRVMLAKAMIKAEQEHLLPHLNVTEDEIQAISLKDLGID